LCGGEAYIRIERPLGSRELGIARVAGGGFAEGCMDVAKFGTCSKLNVGAVVALATRELAGEPLQIANDGVGPCARDLSAGYDGWNYAVGVHDWKNADRLIEKIAEVFDRYDLKGYVGVSVYAVPCGFAF
jgi:hypothetical protein